MINLQRESDVPTSLESSEIKDYLKKLGEWESGVLKEKPKSPPAYRNSDLLEAFDRCFYSKCYLTEQKFANSWSLDVEHFVSKSENPGKTYDWDNLFPCDHNANMVKPRNAPPGGYLNPCCDDPEGELIQVILLGGKSHFRAKDLSNLKAKNSAELLNKIHNGEISDSNSLQKVKQLQLLIDAKLQLVHDCITEWQHAKLSGDVGVEIQQEDKLKELLSRKSSFTMLIRSSHYVKRYVPKEFLD